MKQELKELLKSEHAVLQINELFALRRWTLNPNTDMLGRRGDYLMLEMTNKYGKTRSTPIFIESRDTVGIMKEVECAMQKMMDELKETLCKSWKGGYLF